MMLQQYKQHRVEKVVADAIKILRKNASSPNTIIAALSGGADSVALVTALAAIRDIKVVAAHCNFHLRDEESNRDQRFVEDLCSRLGVALELRHFDVAVYQATHPATSLEMACRDLRYDWFRHLMETHNASRIATGHNADDNIETMLLNLLRGSGTTGLRGMLPDTGTILRPLLSVHRKEIEEYLKALPYSGSATPYIIDSTNLESDFKRNFLRNDIIPLLRQRWPGLDKALDRSLRHLKAENDVIEQSIAAALPADGEPLLRKDALAFAAPELLIRRFILPLQPLTTTAEEIHAAMIADKPDIRRWNLPGGTVTLRGGKLNITH